MIDKYLSVKECAGKRPVSDLRYYGDICLVEGKESMTEPQYCRTNGRNLSTVRHEHVS